MSTRSSASSTAGRVVVGLRVGASASASSGVTSASTSVSSSKSSLASNSSVVLTQLPLVGCGTIASPPDGRIGRSAHLFELLVPLLPRRTRNASASFPSVVVAPSSRAALNSFTASVALPRPGEQQPEVEPHRLALREPLHERAEPRERGAQVVHVEAADRCGDLRVCVVRVEPRRRGQSRSAVCWWNCRCSSCPWMSSGSSPLYWKDG